MVQLVTGGCGFTGSNSIRFIQETHPEDRIVYPDKLTCAGNPANLANLEARPFHPSVRPGIAVIIVGVSQ